MLAFCLRKMVIGQAPQLEIDQERRDKIIEARQALLHVIDIEETWDSVIQSFIELETELMRSAVHSMVQRPDSYIPMGRERLAFGRRMANLLHACRAYLDQTSRRLGLFSNSEARQTFDKTRRAAYDSSFSYRFMEALRNHAQHYDVPLHKTSFSSRWTGDGTASEPGGLEFSVSASVDLDVIRRNADFKRTVLAEVEGHERLDVATLCREYVEELGEVQDTLRKCLANDLANWRRAFTAAIDDYGAINEGNTLGLALAEISEDGRLINPVSFASHLLEWHDSLVRRNGSLINLRRRYTTSAIGPKTAKRRSAQPDS